MNTIKLYKQEIADGLSEMIQSQASVAYCSQATLTGAEVSELPDGLKKLIAKSNPDQLDLYYLESVLVSTGWNKNDDVFERRAHLR